jgi:hypothetical protein
LPSKAAETVQLSRIIARLLELGVSEKWLEELNPTEQQARDLLKGILYLKEMYPDRFVQK